MNKYELFNNCKARIHNQLRIHWKWLKDKDWEEAWEFIETCMNQANKKDMKKFLKLNLQEKNGKR